MEVEADDATDEIVLDEQDADVRVDGFQQIAETVERSGRVQDRARAEALAGQEPPDDFPALGHEDASL